MENFRLKVFRTVARQLNFRRAAEELRLTQPAITGQIKALEEELGCALFNRSGGRVSLTPQGTLLIDYADRLHLLADEAVQSLAALSGHSAGRCDRLERNDSESLSCRTGCGALVKLRSRRQL